MLPTIDILENISKQDLVEMIIEYADNGFYPLQFFTLKSEHEFNIDEINDCWNKIYAFAHREDDNDADRASCILEIGARLVIEVAKRDLSEEEKLSVLRMIVEDLRSAAEDDGIGMKTNSEWQYLEVIDEIEESIG